MPTAERLKIAIVDFRDARQTPLKNHRHSLSCDDKFASWLMNKIDLRRVDLNLLLVLDVLMQEGSVTRAANRLGRTQSAMSHSLKRLREQLGDPLLIKIGDRMQPSPYASELSEQLRSILGSLQRALGSQGGYDPATSSRAFRLALPDFAMNLFPRVFARVHAEAPGVSIDWVPHSDSFLFELAEGLLDVAIAPAWLGRPEGVVAVPVAPMPWACFGRRGHPAFERWSLAEWARWPHVVGGINNRLRTPVSDAATRAGVSRITVATVPHFSAVPPLLAQTDLIATLPALVMTDALAAFDLVAMPLPLEVAPMPHVLAWAQRHSHDLAVPWMRDHVEAVLSSLAKSTESLMQSLPPCAH